MENDNLFAKIKAIPMKKALKLIVFVLGLAVIVFMSAVNLKVNEEFDFIDWLSQSLILMGIMVFGLLLGESVGHDQQTEKVGGLYQSSLKSYNEFLKSIESLVIYFPSFYEWYLPQDLETKKVNYLIAANVKASKARKIVSLCELSDLEDLKEHAIKKEDQDGNEIIIGRLEEHEVPPVQDVLEGRIVIDASGASYYLSAFGGSSSRAMLENGKHLDKAIKFNKGSNRVSKIFFSLVISIALGVLTVREMMSGDDTQAWFNLGSRVLAFLTSLLSGWLSSVITAKLEAEKFNDKRMVLSLFRDSIDKKLFIPIDEETMERMEYEAYESTKTKEEEGDLNEQEESQATDNRG